ncbi:probable cytochrome P450 6a14 [Anabrus simplex]|uniref:probable cytochrome P450 6a14 n=1 Tax=Anabrus simplex TaxID=316456 RepID=UPI0035A3C9EC
MDFLNLFPYSNVLAACGAILGLCFWYYSQAYKYWKNRGIPYVEPEMFFGNTKEFFLMRTPFAQTFEKLYQKLQGHNYGGVFSLLKPILLLRDPELIKNFMIKDFSHFHDRTGVVDKVNNPLSQHLFNLQGNTWRKLRIKLSPTFTSGKIKMMFLLMKECAEEMSEHLKDSAKNGECLEWKDVAANYTTDVIGTCAFGMQFNAIQDPNSELRVLGRKLVGTPTWPKLRTLRRMVVSMFPVLAPLLDAQFPSKAVSDSFLKTVKEIVDLREKNNIKRKDFMQLLIQLKNEGRVEEDNEIMLNGEEQRNGHQKTEVYEDDLKMTDDLLAAQVFVFFVGGFETSSTTISFCLQELAMNPDVQHRLQEEIDSVLRETGGEVTYEAIHKMKYLDQVMSETLRKYPPLGILFRKCTKTYTIPGTEKTIDAGTDVFIPILALHYDPKYFPQPNRFDPDRFREENKNQIPHYAYLPFGEGPRICIGMRFGMVQVKLGLVALLRHYEFKVCEKTNIPLRIDPKSFLTAPLGGIWLQITNRSTPVDQ